MSLLAVMLAVPLMLAIAGLVPRLRPLLPVFTGLAPLPGVAVAFLWAEAPSLALGGFRFVLDGSGAMLLGSAAVLWVAAGVFAAGSLRDRPHFGRWSLCWLLSLTGSLGVFVAADLMTFLTMFALASLPAYFLVIHEGKAASGQAGKVYLGFALLGETCLIMGFVLLAANAPRGGALISDAVAALSTSPNQGLTLALLIAGFAMKMGLVPVHFWLPLAHPAAPAAGSAVLSGAVINCGVVGLIRFLPLHDALSSWGLGIAIIGMATAIYGVLVGITQTNPKTILAYSSVSQMGVIAAMLGMGLSAGDPSVAGDAAFYAMHHTFAKGALFLGVGVVAATGRCQRWTVLVPSALIALGLAGLPFTGGALAKIAAKNVLGSGFAAAFAVASSIGTALLMFIFLRQLLKLAESSPQNPTRASLLASFFGLAVTGFAVRWFVYVEAGKWGLDDPFSTKALWAALWPVLIGGVLAWTCSRYRARVPRIAAGDFGAALLARGRVITQPVGQFAWVVNLFARQWPVAVLLVLALIIALAALSH